MKGLPKQMKSYYNISHLIPCPGCLLMSPRTKIKNTGKYLSVLICKQCHESFKRPSLNNTPPKCDISNGFEIRELPDRLRDATPQVILLTSLTIFSPTVTLLKAGKHRALTKPVTILDSDPFYMN